jgi:hypothetical protein
LVVMLRDVGSYIMLRDVGNYAARRW